VIPAFTKKNLEATPDTRCLLRNSFLITVCFMFSGKTFLRNVGPGRGVSLFSLFEAVGCFSHVMGNLRVCKYSVLINDCILLQDVVLLELQCFAHMLRDSLSYDISSVSSA
jgi:hypothetical protein